MPDFSPNKVKVAEFMIIEGTEFFVSKRHYSEIENCISIDEEIKLKLRNFDKEVVENKTLIIGDSDRQMVKRGNASKGLPKRLWGKKSNFQFGICVNRSGDTVLTRLLKTDQELTKKELRKLLLVPLDYKYQSMIDAECLQCGLYTIIMNDLFVKSRE